MKQWILRFITILIGLLPLMVQAEDLIDVYKEALHCDPTFKAAYAELLVNKENVPINRALLFPSADIHAEADRERLDINGQGIIANPAPPINGPLGVGNLSGKEHIIFYNNVAFYSLTVKQPIFNYESFQKLKKAKASAKAAEARFCEAVELLLVRSASAYFGVLDAYEYVEIVRNEKKALKNLLEESRRQPGLTPLTSVYEVQARYDVVSSEEIRGQIDLVDRMERLRDITGKIPCSLRGLIKKLPIVRPQPANLDCWIQVAIKQNFDLQTAWFELLAARENIQLQFAGHLPVVNALGQYIYENDSNPIGGTGLKIKELVGTLSVDLPVYRSGAVVAKTEQAAFEYKKTDAERQKKMLEVISHTRNAYKRIILFGQKILINEEAVASNEKSLTSTMESYRVGKRTILDVLGTQNALYRAQIDNAKDRYSYILQLISLKHALGTLRVKDLEIINSWLCPIIDLCPFM